MIGCLGIENKTRGMKMDKSLVEVGRELARN